MSTDLITVQEDDILDLPASLMDWRRIRHVAVEDKSGRLVGLVTARMLLRHMVEHHMSNQNGQPLPPVKDIMRQSPATISPEDTIIRAMELMIAEQVGCLPVLKNDKLVGMITEAEFLTITGNLVKRFARKKTPK